MNSYTYRLRNTQNNSDKLGNCEICGKPASEVYYLVQMKQYKRPDGKISSTYEGCFSVFGHKDCLTPLTKDGILKINSK